jgi:hypothetical protein
MDHTATLIALFCLSNIGIVGDVDLVKLDDENTIDGGKEDIK